MSARVRSSGITAADGIVLYAEATGTGPLLLLSPGFCQTHENFRPQVAPLAAAGYCVVLWDYRGHGLSGVPEDPDAYSMERVVDDMARVLDWADGSGRVILGGLSFGGLASLHFTLAHPERVRALLLFASGPGFKNPDAQARWEVQVARVAERLEKRGFAGFLEGRGAATAIGRRTELPAARAAGEAILAQSARGVACFGRRVSGPAPSVIDALPRIEVPALVLVGAQDDAYLRAGEVMAARLPKARHVLVPDAGHVVNIEEAEAFNAAVLDFLADLEPEHAPAHAPR